MGRHYYLNFVQPELVYLLHIYYKNKKISKIYSTHITYTSTFVTLLLLAGTKKVITYFLSIYYDLLCVALMLKVSNPTLADFIVIDGII